jgi:hypothetical protein
LTPRVEAALVKVGIEQNGTAHIGAIAMHRALLLDWACALDHPVCADYAQRLSAEWEANPAVNPYNKIT